MYTRCVYTNKELIHFDIFRDFLFFLFPPHSSMVFFFATVSLREDPIEIEREGSYLLPFSFVWLRVQTRDISIHTHKQSFDTKSKHFN